MNKSWEQFEHAVGGVFTLLGYHVEHDTKLHGGQIDLYATTPLPTKPRLLIECKYHSHPGRKTGVNDVDAFVARVIALRHEGVVDHGYLITNTDFTSDARAKCTSSNVLDRIVFLVRFQDIFNSLLPFDQYLRGYVDRYRRDGLDQLYVGLDVIDVTCAAGTDFDARLYAARNIGGEIVQAITCDDAVSLANTGLISMDADEPRELDALELRRLRRRISKEQTRGYEDLRDAYNESLVNAALEFREHPDFGTAGRSIANELVSTWFMSRPGCERIMLGPTSVKSKLIAASLFTRSIAKSVANNKVAWKDVFDELGLWDDRLAPLVFVDSVGSEVDLRRRPEGRVLDEMGMYWLHGRESDAWVVAYRILQHLFLPVWIRRDLPRDFSVQSLDRRLRNLASMPVPRRWTCEFKRRLSREMARRWAGKRDERLASAPVVRPAALANTLLSWVDKPHWVIVRQKALSALHAWLASDSSLLILLGDYGAGKTTVVRYLMYELAQQALAPSLEGLDRVPLIINLREYNRIGDIRRLIHASLQGEGGLRDLSWPILERLDERGSLVFILDGFDEMLAQVTASERRRCFREVLSITQSSSKVILAGRPGYFPEHRELAGLLEAAARGDTYVPTRPHIDARILCLQLMEDDEVAEFCERFAGGDAESVLSLIDRSDNLRDLVRRPVLAAMICAAKKRIAEAAAGDSELTVRRLYEIYTGDWIEREEDKTAFRLLMDAEQKSKFMRCLAMQMHLSGALGIHFTVMDKRIGKYFGLSDADEIDHFSHDVRTCSFLNRDDSGVYRFIHKSFMEFFAALEYEELDDSPFCEAFDQALTAETIAFLDIPRLVRALGGTDPFAFDGLVIDSIGVMSAAKDDAVRMADYELAANLRDLSEQLRKERELPLFGSMRRGTFARRFELVRDKLQRMKSLIAGSEAVKMDAARFEDSLIEVERLTAQSLPKADSAPG